MPDTSAWKPVDESAWKPVNEPPPAPPVKHDVITGAVLGGPDAPIGEQPVSLKGQIKTFGETLKGAGKELGSTAYNLATGPGAGPIGMGLGYLGKRFGITPKVEAATQPSNTSQSIGKYGAMAGELLAPMPGAVEMLPNAARAGENLNKALALAKDVPVDVSKFSQPVLRAKQLNAVAGDPMAPVLRKALTRIGPTTEPLTYGDTRILASSAGRKAQQAAMGNTLTGEMGKRLGETAKGLDVAAQDAANVAGPEAGRYHSLGMSEYRNAKRLEKAGDVAKKAAIGAALTGGAYEGGKHIVRKLAAP